MRYWRQKVLDIFQAPFSHLTLVSDPDHLLDDEIIVTKLTDRGLEVAKFQDRASFRYLYETEYCITAPDIYLLVVCNSELVTDLPYDIWSNGQIIELRKSILFPQMSPHIVRQLDFRTLDVLSEVTLSGSLYSDRATTDFILRHIYKLPYDSIYSLSDCLSLVVRWHQLPYEVPEAIKHYLTDFLQDRVPGSPVRQWMNSLHDFVQYLQQEWQRFVQEDDFPEAHVFWDPNVRSVIGPLFAEGVLTALPIEQVHFPEAFTWGISPYSSFQKKEMRKEWLHQLESLLAAPTADRRAWVQIARLYGKIKCVTIEMRLQGQDGSAQSTVETELETRFEHWLSEHYAALATLTDRSTPVMVHKTVEVLRLKNKDKIAVIVADGMSFVQWAQIEGALKTDFRFDVTGSFAWIPTLTSVSRQSIFSGEIPRFFYDSINTTAKEEKAWKSVWERHGIPSVYVSYERGLGQGTYERSNIVALSKSKNRVAGLVVDTIDQFTHHSIQGQLGMHAEIAVWLKQGYLQFLLSDLLDAGYDVYLTSDHGNMESKGVGATRDGTLPETRGERVRVYRDVVLRDQAAVKYTGGQWMGTGLPDDYHALIAKTGEAFVREGELVVSHGGASLQEVIVPFVHIQKK